APPQIKETQLPHRTAPIGQIQRDSLNLICWPRGRGIFRDALYFLRTGGHKTSQKAGRHPREGGGSRAQGDETMKPAYAPFDPADYLDNNEAIAEYLTATRISVRRAGRNFAR
ncbi:MAG: hypothetical protein ACR2KT_13310, partial [Methylocella sp.]